MTGAVTKIFSLRKLSARGPHFVPLHYALLSRTFRNDYEIFNGFFQTIQLQVHQTTVPRCNQAQPHTSAYYVINMYLLTRKYKTGNLRIKVKYRRVRVTTDTVEKQYVLHVLSVRLQHQVASMHTACAVITLSAVACLALKYFSTFSHKRHVFRGGEHYLTKNV